MIKIKQIYPVATKQTLFYFYPKIFKKDECVTSEVIGRLHYIYAESQEEAFEKYRKRFSYNYKNVMSSFSIIKEDENTDWYCRNVSVANSELCIYDYKNVTTEMLYKDMDANDFRDWFNNNLI